MSENPRRLSSHKAGLVLGIAASIESIAEMRDEKDLKDMAMRLNVIQADAQRIRNLIRPSGQGDGRE